MSSLNSSRPVWNDNLQQWEYDPPLAEAHVRLRRDHPQLLLADQMKDLVGKCGDITLPVGGLRISLATLAAVGWTCRIRPGKYGGSTRVTFVGPGSTISFKIPHKFKDLDLCNKISLIARGETATGKLNATRCTVLLPVMAIPAPPIPARTDEEILLAMSQSIRGRIKPRKRQPTQDRATRFLEAMA